MFKDKYPSIFSRQMQAICVYYPSNIFGNALGFEDWGISLGLGNIQSHDAFRPIGCERKHLMNYNSSYYNVYGSVSH